MSIEAYKFASVTAPAFLVRLRDWPISTLAAIGIVVAEAVAVDLREHGDDRLWDAIRVPSGECISAKDTQVWLLPRVCSRRWVRRELLWHDNAGILWHSKEADVHLRRSWWRFR